MGSRFFTIVKGPHSGKRIHVTSYSKTTEGVDIEIEHNVPTLPGKELQWVQTVTSNNQFSIDCKMMTRVDPFSPIGSVSLPSMPGICKADDLLPFYWTADDLASGAGPGFSDTPHAPPPKKGRIWNQYVTALTEVTGTTVHHLVAITWGYDRMADGSVREDRIRLANTVEMKRHGFALKKMYPSFHYT